MTGILEQSFLDRCDNGIDESSSTGDTLASLPEGLWVLARSVGDNTTNQRVNVIGPKFTIGRHPSSNLCLSDSTVSGRHAEIMTINRDLFVRDLNSTNGTLLNGRKLQNLTGLRSGDVLHFGSVMYTLQSSTDENMSSTITADVSSEALAQVQFDKLLRRPALRPYYQPIIRLTDNACMGFEVLSRSYLLGLETPDKMFRVAATRNVEAQLSQVCRSEGLRIGTSLGNARFYLNTHPVELQGTELFTSLEQLRSDFPDMQIVLEVHEGAVASSDVLRKVREVTRELKMGLAYDDFGAGQARLKELFEVPPDVLKFDVKFIHGLSFSPPQHRATIQSLIRIVRDLNVVPLAEGVESQEEAEICQELGFELAQGYFFGRPETASHWTTT
ncbi:MAG: EAL domain-containing protein [Planctomycetota bacterium]|nr:EAL domain-containing protein [Planctomycetota bacterium]